MKKWKIILLSIAFTIAILGNIAYAIWGSQTYKDSILTVISGWISGIATAIIGIIAFRQNMHYKIESDINLEKQYSFEKSKLYLEEREETIKNINSTLSDFQAKNSALSFYQKVSEIVSLNNPQIKTVQQNHLEFEVSFFLSTICDRCLELKEYLNADMVDSEQKNTLISYIDQLSDVFKQFGKTNPPSIKEYILPIYSKFSSSVREYILFLQLDFKNCVDKIDDISYLKCHLKKE